MYRPSAQGRPRGRCESASRTIGRAPRSTTRRRAGKRAVGGGRCGRHRDCADRQGLERVGRLRQEVGARPADDRERPAPVAAVAGDVLRGRDRHRGPRPGEPLWGHVPGRSGHRPRHERAHRVGLDGHPDGRDRCLPGAARARRGPARGDGVSRQQRADADHPGGVQGESARGRRSEQSGAGAARPVGATRGGRRPRHGPLITAPSGSAPTALSVQHTGFYATREIVLFRELSRARNVDKAKCALRFFDFGAQNWMLADRSGNIAYYTSAEIPLREDLQAGAVLGLPPFFIRDGTGGNEWIADATQAEDQAIPFEVLPFAEMDQLVNPQRGWIANANQDPTGQTFDNDPLNELRPGGGIRYITPGHSDGNRNARITQRLEEALAGDEEVSFAQMESIQADVK